MLNTKNVSVSIIPDFYVDSVRSYTHKSWITSSGIYKVPVLVSFSSINVFYILLFGLIGTYLIFINLCEILGSYYYYYYYYYYCTISVIGHLAVDSAH